MGGRVEHRERRPGKGAQRREESRGCRRAIGGAHGLSEHSKCCYDPFSRGFSIETLTTKEEPKPFKSLGRLDICLLTIRRKKGFIYLKKNNNRISVFFTIQFIFFCYCDCYTYDNAECVLLLAPHA